MNAPAAALTVEDALSRVLSGATAANHTEEVALHRATGRILAGPLSARLTQPPFNASAMDGYAVRCADVGALPARLRVIGRSAAGHGFHAPVGAGEAVRIFTGAPLPEGTDGIIIQEDVVRDGDWITIASAKPDPEYVRRKGFDFTAGRQILDAGRRLSARDITLAAAMGHGALTVRRRPTVAILATGDELVTPGTTPAQDQIVCSNNLGIAAMVEAAGGAPVLLGIARDTCDSLNAHIETAADADVLVTIGGASVGDHDLVGPVLQSRGMSLDFWKIAMRPGKPLMFGRLGPQRVLGLPGNPVSSLICTRLFVLPLVRALLGLEPEPQQTLSARTTVPLEANGARAHYMRAIATRNAEGTLEATPVRSQDSSLLTPLAEADCLIVRPIKAPALPDGASVPVLMLDF